MKEAPAIARCQLVWWGWRYWAFGCGQYWEGYAICAFRWLRIGPCEFRVWRKQATTEGN